MCGIVGIWSKNSIETQEKFVNKIGLNGFLVWLFKFTKMYPSLWYVVGKK